VHYTLMLVERSSSGLNNPFANPVCRHAYTCWQITYQQRQISPPTHLSLQVSKPHHVYICMREHGSCKRDHSYNGLNQLKFSILLKGPMFLKP
jgi:hypothetical protein